MSNLTVIDGHNYLFRAFYGVPEAAQTKGGIQVNAVYGFFAFIRQIVAAYPQNKLFVVFDSETGIEDKLEIKTEYKAERPVNTDMFKQLPYIKQILDLMNIKWIEHPSFEADDIIASIATHWSEKIGTCYISSNDFDFVQMVSDKIVLLRAVQGKLINCDDAFIRQKFNIQATQYVEYLSLVGDKSDNIAGVPGIGKKTASDLLNKYGNLDTVYIKLGELAGGLRKKLTLGQNIVYKNRDFIKMRRQIPLAQILPDVLPKTNTTLIQQKIAIYLDKIGVR